jgi:cytoskeletal protein CcmA (bactofilin family)
VSDHQLPEGTFINSIIGEGTRFNGEFDLNGLLRIDGDFCGTVRTKGKVLVGKNGRAECTVYAGTVVVGGIVRGNIFAEEKVVILSTGIVLGNIHSPRFIVEEGVIFNGTARIVHAVHAVHAMHEVHERKSRTPSIESGERRTPSAAASSPAADKKAFPVAAP